MDALHAGGGGGPAAADSTQLCTWRISWPPACLLAGPDSMEDDSPETRSGKVGRYANFFKVGYNEYEFLLDFGQAFREEEAAAVHTRIVTTAVYAKALCRTLRDSIHDYEAQYGKLPEADPEH